MQNTVDRKRFFLAMMISGAILLLWQIFLAPEPPVSKNKQTAENQVEAGQEGAAIKSADPADKAAPKKVAAADSEVVDDQAPVQARDIPTREDVLGGEHLKVGVTNKEAVVTSVRILKPSQYAGTGPEDKPGDLVGFPEGAPQYPFGISFLGKGVELPDSTVFEVVESASEKSTEGVYSKIVYRHEDPRGRFTIDKSYTVDSKLPYIVNMDVAITNTSSQGRLDDTMALDILRWNDPDAESSFLDFQPIQTEGVCKTTDDIERETYSTLNKDGPVAFGEFQTIWGGVDTRYFMLAAIPGEMVDNCEFSVVHKDYVRTRLTGAPFSVEPGKTVTFSNQLFMGPKDVDVLGEVRPDLTESVDYGIFAFVARPMRWSLNQLFGLVGNWGLAIILLTFIIRALLWPVNMKAYSSMERMKAVQPLLAEIKEKYKDDKQRQTEETMKAFKKHNVSPAGGCLPMILQMPVLYGLYVCIYNSVDLYNANFVLWYTDLASPDPYYALPILMGVAMFFQQRLSSVDTSNKQAAMMMKIMPVMFTAFMLFLPSGLVLYYALSLLIGVAQQYFIRKKFEGEPELTLD
ncbi:membrane protein insertase YidC [Bradymonas sediminis]|uniref:Membrane protein insertase YidC n=1 Tax=Bradymonas sediminis TaxID=1548548 RepID=A0A2Z4FHH5_9DELT|nr:membrane protein insertase YidC [Bradymonas sediminis]AWV88205.1 hypothetical protein DN745_02165 [Bradymonas sediminis]TDP77327.1 YidC/Oxa1 family membrane protein insertase [Bradymonas sediminis]